MVTSRRQEECTLYSVQVREQIVYLAHGVCVRRKSEEVESCGVYVKLLVVVRLQVRVQVMELHVLDTYTAVVVLIVLNIHM